MQNEISEIKLQFRKKEEQLKVPYISLTETAVHIKPIVDNLKNGCLLVRRHRYHQTQLILTAAGSCIFMLFDAGGKYMSTRYHDGYSGAPFSFFVHEMFVLILPIDIPFINLNPRSLEITFPGPDLLCKNRFGSYETLGSYSHFVLEERCLLDEYEDNVRRDAESKNKKKGIPHFTFKVMECIIIQQPGDDDVIRNYKKSFEGYALETLIESYNKHARIGIVRGHLQTLYLLALKQEFVERLISSPIYLNDHSVGMKGEIEIVNGEVRVKNQ